MSNQKENPVSVDGANRNRSNLLASVSSGRSRALARRRFAEKLSYGLRWLPGYAWQTLTRRAPRGSVHLMIALADHFEPAIVPENGQARAPYHEQQRRLERWCREYPKIVDGWRDGDGRPFTHTYFYPAEQYDHALL